MPEHTFTDDKNKHMATLNGAHKMREMFELYELDRVFTLSATGSAITHLFTTAYQVSILPLYLIKSFFCFINDVCQASPKSMIDRRHLFSMWHRCSHMYYKYVQKKKNMESRGFFCFGQHS